MVMLTRSPASSRLTDAKPVKYSSRDEYAHLMSEGVAIYEFQPTMMHTKVMVVDGVWSMFGSANFDNRSLELNDEMNVAVSEPALARRLDEEGEARRRVRATKQPGSTCPRRRPKARCARSRCGTTRPRRASSPSSTSSCGPSACA